MTMTMAMVLTLVFACANAPDASKELDTSDAALTREIVTYLDGIEALKNAGVGVKRPEFLPIELRFGGKRAWAEIARQVTVRNSDFLYGRFFGLDRSKTEQRDIAVRGLKSEDKVFRERALSWCAIHTDMLDDEQKKAARDILAAAVKAENGQDLENLKLFASFGTKQDIAWLRKIYQDHFFVRSPSYSVRWPIFRRVTRSQFLILLGRLGDPETKKEIAVAIGQEENVDQRVWGIVMASNLGEKSLVPLIGKALDDKRKAPEPIEEWRDPDAKGPYLLRVSYHRVCDVALRAIWTIDEPKEKWPLKMDIMASLKHGSWTFLHGESNATFPYVEPLEKKANQDRGVFLNHTILGYTDEQLEQVREYVKKRPALLEKGK